MSRIVFLTFLFVFVSAGWLGAQETKRTRQKVECSWPAILAAGKKTDSESLWALKKLRWSGTCADHKPALLMALARRGDIDSQNALTCDTMLLEIPDLSYIGGWYGIRLAFYLPDQEKDYHPVHSDVIIVGSPRIWAISALNKMVKKPPDGGMIGEYPSDEEAARAEKVWRTWLKSNKAELSKMHPRGPAKLIPKSCNYG